MNIQELQVKYINGEISYNEYLEKIEELRQNAKSTTRQNNSWFYIAGIGCLFLIGVYLSKR